MTSYDFVITNLKVINNKYNLKVEKVAVLDNDRLLNQWLLDNGVSDIDAGLAIEKLERLPYSDKTVYVNDNIIITQ